MAASFWAMDHGGEDSTTGAPWVPRCRRRCVAGCPERERGVTMLLSPRCACSRLKSSVDVKVLMARSNSLPSLSVVVVEAPLSKGGIFSWDTGRVGKVF